MTSAPYSTPAPRDGRRPFEIVAGVAAIALHLVVLVPFTVATGLLAPLWAIVAFDLVWLAGTVVLAGLVRRRPVAALLVPSVTALVLYAGVTVGGTWLGWTP